MNFKWIEKLDEDTIEHLFCLLNESVEDKGMLGFDSNNQEEIHQYIGDLSQELDKKTSHLLGVFNSSGSLIGMLVVKTNSIPTHKHIAEITKTLIRKRYRGSKGGGILFEGFSEILNFSEVHDISVLRFDVREGSRAEKIWRRLGFNTYGRLEKYSQYEGRYFPGVYMYGEVSDLKNNLG